MSTRRVALSTLGALALAACSADNPVITAPGAAPTLLTAATAVPTRHLVLFSTAGVPTTFAATISRLGGRIETTHAGVGYASVLELTPTAAAELRKQSGIAAVTADAPLRRERPVALEDAFGRRIALDLDAAAVDAAAAVTPESPTAPQTAFFYPFQWNMRAISAQSAWAAPTAAGRRLGSPNVKIAILDTGIDDLNVDVRNRVLGSLSASMLTTHGQFDDEGNPILDKNGDQVMVTDNDSVTANWPGAPLWVDLHYHGTHVGATVSSNALGAAGMTSQTRLIAVKVCSFVEGVGCPESAVFAGITHAVDNGADVINMSLGGTFSKSEESARGGTGPAYVAFVNRFLSYANSKGVTVVVSAGNSALDLDHDQDGYKTYCNNPNVICVSATGPLQGPISGPGAFVGPFSNVDAPAVYTNFGSSGVDVAAPGGNYTTALIPVPGGDPVETVVSGGFIWAACSGRSLAPGGCKGSIGSFTALAGTSMASPHVAGLAALLVETYGRNPSAIRSAIEAAADDKGKSGTDPYYGKGRINVARALGLPVI